MSAHWYFCVRDTRIQREDELDKQKKKKKKNSNESTFCPISP